ncbi:hypothetical protein BC938DRAFT_472818 [Jimgerdemannia flammicorona]|uniref:Uncharacterized protein n=1 Tax=Jimgerdemannia flammicorona TaxID=994334 RepID=A0A433Q5B7_9FUNG|nr:hypothetical protein BC938DRAFT_472818 [Jimgerdemannia flammicorona]
MGQVFSKTKKFIEGRRSQLDSSKDNKDYSLPPTCDSNGNPVTEDSKLIDGRQFKKSGSPVYLLPNDIGEFERLNMQHFLFSWLASTIRFSSS